jgi:stearoyl-CoA desaturase (delta-9 desaturase)
MDVTAISGIRFGGAPALRRRIDNAILLGIPIVGTCIAFWHVTKYGVSLTTVLTFAVLYLWTAIGGTLGLHRYFTHRSFKASKAARIFLGVGACLNMQGRIVRWVADHRRHHRFEDRPGDPHSPLWTDRGRRLPRIGGLLHAHFFWMFNNSSTDPNIFCPDLLDDPLIQHFEKFYYFYVALSILLPMVVGIAGGAVEAIRCLLWAGCVRVLLVQHATFSVNSIGHSFGRQDFKGKDSSRNLWIFSIFLLGDGYHNNHHAFPGSAQIALLPGQFDPGYAFLRGLERFGLVSNIVTVTPEQVAKRSECYLRSQVSATTGIN